MPTDDIDQITESLVLGWMYYKSKTLERAGVKHTAVSRERVVGVYGEQLRNLAKLISQWDTPARLVMAAMWAYSVHLKHYQGPYPTHIANANVVRKALSFYLGLPLEAVIEQTSRRAIVAAIEADYLRRLPTMIEAARAGPLAFAMSPSLPACFRVVVLTYGGGLSGSDMAVLALDALMEADADARLFAWLDSRGISFDRLAGMANQEFTVVMQQAGALVDLIKSAEQAAVNNAPKGEIANLLVMALELCHT